MATRGSLPGIQWSWSGCETDQSPAASAKVKNEWSFTSNLPHEFTTPLSKLYLTPLQTLQ